MNRKKQLQKEVFFFSRESFGHFHDCKNESHDNGNCFPCRILNICFKKNKILRLNSMGYNLRYMEILKPTVITHRNKRETEKSHFYKKANIKFKTLKEFKEHQIEMYKWLCRQNNLNREILGNSKNLYFFIETRLNDIPVVLGFNFFFANWLFDKEMKKFEEGILGIDEEIEETIEITEKKSIINRKRIRLGLSSEIRKRIYKRDNYTCHYCKWQNGIPGRPDKPLTLDHVTPQAFGGSSKDDNLVTCCFDCNVKKNDKFLPLVIKKWIWNPETQTKDKQCTIDTEINNEEMRHSIEENVNLLP